MHRPAVYIQDDIVSVVPILVDHCQFLSFQLAILTHK